MDEEIEQLSVPTSLKDPLVQTRIDIPARGEHCSHAQVRFIYFPHLF